RLRSCRGFGADGIWRSGAFPWRDGDLGGVVVVQSPGGGARIHGSARGITFFADRAVARARPVDQQRPARVLQAGAARSPEGTPGGRFAAVLARPGAWVCAGAHVAGPLGGGAGRAAAVRAVRYRRARRGAAGAGAPSLGDVDRRCWPGGVLGGAGAGREDPRGGSGGCGHLVLWLDDVAGTAGVR